MVITTAAEHHANLLPWSRTATCRYVECGKDGTFDTVEGVPHALVAARLAAEYAIGVGHSRFCAYPCMIRLLGLTREEVHRYHDQARREDRRAMPGAVRASAGINISDDDVRRLLAAVASIAAGDPP